MFSVISFISFLNSSPTSFLSVFNYRRMTSKLDPLELLFDPNLMINPGSFLRSLSSWASMPSSGTNPNENLNRFKVRTIMHNRQSATPEHDILVIDLWDMVKSEKKVLILDRIYDKGGSVSAAVPLTVP